MTMPAPAAQPAIRIGQGQRPGAEADPRLDWWRDARFGLFIHWGLYAIPAGRWHGEFVPGIGEWIMHRKRIPVAEYAPLAAQFNPIDFDADAWVRLAVEAGQKYVVITAKHHDGFCLWDSQVSNYTITKASPFGRDVVRELSEACAHHGLRFGFYYSQTQDWHHPGGDGNDWDYDDASRDFDGYVENYVVPQVRELMTGYGPICLIWYDTPKRMTAAQSRRLTDLVHELQPDCLVNGRVGNDMGDYAEAGDNVIPDETYAMDFETPATINHTWGFKTDDTDWKSPAELIHKLVELASKGGNYLLNVGPTATGIIPEASAEALRGAGTWLAANPVGVYRTRRGPYLGLPGMWATRDAANAHRIYLHVFEWPADGQIHLPGAQADGTLDYVDTASLANGTHAPLTLHRDATGLTIVGPHDAPDAINTVIALE
jgi:alpha-L-fucosidase